MKPSRDQASSVRDTTIYSLATELGLSPSTVSRAFSRPDLVRAGVRDRILALAEERGYAPSRVARSLATGRTGLFGLLVGDITNPFFPPLVRAVEHATNVLDSAVLLVDARSGGRAEHELVRRVAQHVDGMILASPRARTADLRAALGRTPAVLINRAISGVPSVTCHARDAHREAADHLAGLGHRRIALMRGPSESWVAQRRTDALRRWASARSADGVELVELPPMQSSYALARTEAENIVATGATAVIAIDDYCAAGFIAGAEQLGIEVPADISVVGCDGVLFGEVMRPQLTTVLVPGPELGRAAVSLLNQVLAGQEVKNLTMTGKLRIGGTTGPARRS